MPKMRCAVASSNTHRATAGAQAIPSIGSAIFRARRVIGSRSLNKNESAQPSRQMRRILASKLPTTAPSKSEMSSTKMHPPNVDARRFGSLRAYQRVPSLKSTVWAGPYVNGRSHTWPTSAQPQPATHRSSQRNHRTKQRNRQRLPQPTNYQLRVLLIAGGRDASTHTQL